VSRDRRFMRLRVALLGALVFVGAGFVVRRSYELSVERAPALREMAEEQYQRNMRLAPKRGTIRDRNGAPLAVSVDVDSVYANPRRMRREGVDLPPALIALAALDLQYHQNAAPAAPATGDAR